MLTFYDLQHAGHAAGSTGRDRRNTIRYIQARPTPFKTRTTNVQACESCRACIRSVTLCALQDPPLAATGLTIVRQTKV